MLVNKPKAPLNKYSKHHNLLLIIAMYLRCHLTPIPNWQYKYLGKIGLLGIWLLIHYNWPVNWKGKTKIVLNIPRKCQNNKEMQAKNTQKKLKIAMKWAKTPFKTLISFANLSLWSIPIFNSRIHVSKYRKYGQNAK